MIGGIHESPGPCNASGGHGHGHGHGQRKGSGWASSTVLYDRMAHAMDLNMMCMVGEGRERTEAEFRSVFARAGFRLVHAAPTKSPMFAMLLEPCDKH